MTEWLVDGVSTGSVPIADRGFQYGDGLFETIAVRRGAPRFLDAHLRRLESGLERLGMPRGAGTALAPEVRRVAAGCDFGAAKIIVTRGCGPRGYRPPEDAEPRRVVGLAPSEPWPRHYYDPGIVLRVCRTPIGTNRATAGIKTLGRLDQVLARSEWSDPEVAEGLMLDAERCIVSGTMTNFFFVRNGRLHTPSLTEAGIAGIMRAIVIDQARAMGVEVAETRARIEELRDAEELFVTNSQIGIWPVRRFVERALGPARLTRELMRGLVDIGVEECAT